MSINEKIISHIAKQIGVNAGKNQKLINEWKEKSDGELLSEIKKIQKQLEDNNISKSQQKQLLQSLMPMLGEDQKYRLEKILNQIR